MKRGRKRRGRRLNRKTRWSRKRRKDPAYRDRDRARSRAGMQALYTRRREAGLTSSGRKFQGQGRYHHELTDAGITEVRSDRNVDTPRLTWMDHNGSLHHEDLRSAEQVIRDWEKQNPTKEGEP